MRRKDYAPGYRFPDTKLILLRTVYQNGKAIATCQCDCGNIWTGRLSHIGKHNTTSCGCRRKEVLNRTTHGQSIRKNGDVSPLYKVWKSIKQRCTNPCDNNYKNYGGRGIIMCEEWLESSDAFFKWAEKNGYNDKLQIDRIDNNAGYSPKNCRFVDRKTNMRNVRNNIYLTINGDTKLLLEWSVQSGIPYSTLWARVKRGWSGPSLLKPVR